jgi:hypothetical protein
MQRSISLTIAVLMIASLVVTPALASTVVTTPNGTWTAYPGQSASYQTSVQQPINTDGSSNFKANGKAVIPVKFGLAQGLGAFAFESIYSDNATDTTTGSPCATGHANDCAFLTFTPGSTVTFNDITELSALYEFTIGDCHGGSLRWSVRTSSSQSVFIYYGNPPQFGSGSGGCTSSANGGADQSGVNLIGLSDLRYDTSQYAGGTFYDTYAHTQDLIGDTPILRASLVLDSGWQNAPNGDQQLTLSSATIRTAAFTDTFTPQPPSPLTSTCPTQEASIKITKTDGTPTGDVNEPISIQPQDNNGIFRIVDCKYMYNLATSSLSGVGTYKVYAIINGVQATNPAVFDLK